MHPIGEAPARLSAPSASSRDSPLSAVHGIRIRVIRVRVPANQHRPNSIAEYIRQRHGAAIPLTETAQSRHKRSQSTTSAPSTERPDLDRQRLTSASDTCQTMPHIQSAPWPRPKIIERLGTPRPALVHDNSGLLHRRRADIGGGRAVPGSSECHTRFEQCVGKEWTQRVKGRRLGTPAARTDERKVGFAPTRPVQRTGPTIAPTPRSGDRSRPASRRGRALFERCDLLIEIRGRDDAVVEVAEIEPLVRRVRVFVRQADAEQHARQAELLLERRDDRNRAAFAVEHRRLCRSPARSRGRRRGRTCCRTPSSTACRRACA